MKPDDELDVSYGSDDYSRYAGPDFREASRSGRPGVSGKARGEGSWINRNRYAEQKSFAGVGPRNYRRSDERIFEEVCDILYRSPDVDASNIGVKVEDGTVNLSGWVLGRQMKRLAEYLIEDLPGVKDVRNELTVERQ